MLKIKNDLSLLFLLELCCWTWFGSRYPRARMALEIKYTNCVSVEKNYYLHEAVFCFCQQDLPVLKSCEWISARNSWLNFGEISPENISFETECRTYHSCHSCSVPQLAYIRWCLHAFMLGSCDDILNSLRHCTLCFWFLFCGLQVWP